MTFEPSLYQPPFPWFGGKSRAAGLVWERFGDMPNYVEPFFGSGAVLFNRPHWPFSGNRIETINDKDTYVANFWRALANEPEAVAGYADYPVNEADLHARHWWLVNQVDFRQRMMDDPDYYDTKIAGWWVWGICQWIGSGWCEIRQKRNHLGNPGRGVHRPSQQLNHLGDPGQGVHRPSQQRNHLGNPGQGDIYDYMYSIAERLRRVRVICGDWQRVLGPTPTEKLGLTGIFLDPPYNTDAGRKNDLYATEDTEVSHAVREWAIEHGDNPLLRIALCGYDSEHTHLMPNDWECIKWKANGGYSNQGNGGNDNATRERIWFSPACLKPAKVEQMALMM